MSAASDRPRADFGKNRRLKAIVGAYAVWWVLMAVRPVYPADWLLENLLVVPFVAVLAGTYRRFPLSDLSYGLVALFLALHAVGAHYTYSEVPIGDWAREAFGLSRNHFDRVVHLAYGLLLAYPVREVLQRAVRARDVVADLLALGVTLASSALYELIEWGVAVVVDPEAGAAYLGAQGDPWDAQKDMALAGLGAVVAMVATAARCARRR
ncbi:MAG TPA: DUF2238 domain-containing protein [Thermodesulfobacteriota bacterium]